jgi:2-polyprenyl-3-methyl-5-hydroxy-6-metoxy-1,4-benzoquinol methylase
MSQNIFDCPYGNASENCHWRDVPGKVRDESNVGILECTNCQMKKHAIDLRYKINYESGSMHNWTGGYGEELKGPGLDKERRFQFINELMSKNISPSLLDFGCGNGEMLEVFDSTFNLVMGLEPDSGARAIATQRGFKVVSDISDLENIKEKFDLITLFHVIEHIYNPIELLKKISSLLKPDGFLIIETPNSQDALLSLYECSEFENFTYWSHHPFLYSNKSLEILLNSVGFEMLFNTGVQRYSLDNHLYWLSKNKPGGHNVWGNFFDFEVLKAYNENLIQNRVQDTIWIVARMR